MKKDKKLKSFYLKETTAGEEIVLPFDSKTSLNTTKRTSNKAAPENVSNSSSGSDISAENLSTVELKLKKLTSNTLKFNSPFESPKTIARSHTDSSRPSIESDRNFSDGGMQSKKESPTSPKKGSVFKARTLLANLEHHLPTPETELQSPKTPTFIGTFKY